MLGRKKAVIISLILAYTIAVPVFAYLYFYRTENYIAAGIILRTYDTPTMKLGIYWDAECTQPATTIDYGNMTHPNQYTEIQKTFWIKNEGDNWNDIRWNSTLTSITTEITDLWNHWEGGSWGHWFPLNGTRLESGQVLQCVYSVFIQAYATVGTYNWTLTVWGENYY